MSRGIRDGAAIRRERMMMILQMVRSHPGIHIDRIQREIAWETGLTPRRISQYVQELVEIGKLVQKEQGFRLAGARK